MKPKSRMVSNKEIWKPIPGYENCYAVSNLGRVKSRWYRRGRRRCVLKPGINWSGHLKVGLCRDGKVKYHYLHRLVLLAFVGTCPKGMECRHFPDRNPTNNRLDNLSWATHIRNVEDRKIHGTNRRAKKLSNKNIPIIKRLAEKESQRSIAKIFGVSQSTIWRYLNHGSS